MMGFLQRQLERAAELAGYHVHRSVNPLGSVWQVRPPLLGFERRAEVPIVVEQAGDPIDASLVDSVFSFLERIPPFYDDAVPEPLRIDGLWRSFLQKERPSQIECLGSGDRERYRELLTDLFFNELSRGLQNYGIARAGEPVSFELRVDCDAFERLSDRSWEELATNARYRLAGWRGERGIVRNTDPQHGIQATHLLNLARAFGVPSERLTILDLGSGYGGLAEKIYTFSDTPPLQILVDIPLNLTTAYVYLAHTFGPERVELIADASELERIDRSRVAFVLVPSCFSDALATSVRWDLVHNAKSLSEMELRTADYYVSRFVDEDCLAFIETNSNRPGTTSFEGTSETLSRQISVPDTHVLLSRFPDSRVGRYATSVYLRRASLTLPPAL